MEASSQLEADRERLSALICKYTGISAKRVYGFIIENGAGELMSSGNMLAKTEAQREKLNNLADFKNLYETVKGADNKKEYVLSSTEEAMDYFKHLFSDKNDRERVVAVFLDAANKIIATKTMSDGSVNQSPVNPREITREALFQNAVAVIMAHNHPTGVIIASTSDVEATDRVEKSLAAVGIALHDHIIVAGSTAISIADSGRLGLGAIIGEMSKAASPVKEEADAYMKNESLEVNTTMSETNITNPAGTGSVSIPLAENEHVKELLGILRDNGRDASGLTALLDHVQGMENFIKTAESKIADMKAQLDEMKEVQDHPVKTALQKAIKSLEEKVAAVKERLSELKTNIVEGCKNAVAAFKEKGIAALSNIMSFFKVKSCLQAIKGDTAKTAAICDKTVGRIEAFSNEYHMTGRHLRNMGRVLTGKPPIDAAKESGRLAKAISAPYRAEKACMLGIMKAAESAIMKINSLEQRIEARRAERPPAEKKPGIMERLQEKKELIKQKELEGPRLERAPKSKGLEV